MVPDWNLILSALGLAVVLVGGFVKLRLDITAKFGGVYSRLDKIETTMNLEEKYADERNAQMLVRLRTVVHEYCRDECPHNRTITNPGIRIGVDTP